MKFKTESAFYLDRLLIQASQDVDISDLPLAVQLFSAGKISPADPETVLLFRSMQHPAWEPLSEDAAQAFATQARFAPSLMTR